MSTKRFCNICGTETKTSFGGGNFTGEQTLPLTRKTLQISVTVDPAPPVPDFDICRNCVIDAVLSLDARPKWVKAEKKPDPEQVEN